MTQPADAAAGKASQATAGKASQVPEGKAIQPAVGKPAASKAMPAKSVTGMTQAAGHVDGAGRQKCQLPCFTLVHTTLSQT